jgi:hypothetical protein
VLEVEAKAASTGAFLVEVQLVGDLNADRRVDGNDRLSLIGLLRTGGYSAEADANHDGILTSFDYAQMLRNVGAATTIQPLSLTLEVEPAPTIVLPTGERVVGQAELEVSGTVLPGNLVQIDADKDGLFEDSQTAEPDGDYLFAVTLAEGANTLLVQASDRFGQIAASSIDVIFETPPGPFEILGPSGYINDRTPLVDFSDSIRAESYDVFVALSPEGSSVVQSHVGLSESHVTLSPLGDGEYFLVVNSENIAGTAAANNGGLAFTVDATPPEPFDILSPNGPIFSTRPVVRWSSAVDNSGVVYDVVLSTLPDRSNPIQVFESVSRTFVTLAELTVGTYYVGVTAHDAAGNSTIASNGGSTFEILDPTVGSSLTVFVTSNTYSIDFIDSVPPLPGFFGGMAAADWQVTAEAATAGLITNWDQITPIYRAILSDSHITAPERIPENVPIFNTAGQFVASGRDDLFDCMLDAPIAYTPTGSPVGASDLVWTGTTCNGFHHSSAIDWLDFFGTAMLGRANHTDHNWTSAASGHGGNNHRLYAIGPFPVAQAIESFAAMAEPITTADPATSGDAPLDEQLASTLAASLAPMLAPASSAFVTPIPADELFASEFPDSSPATKVLPTYEIEYAGLQSSASATSDASATYAEDAIDELFAELGGSDALLPQLMAVGTGE